MSAEYDFIVVGAGAGGGPLAANLALAPEGFRVALVEAGGDPAAAPGTAAYYNYAIPALHAHASEEPAMSWPFFVRHYTDPERQKQDSKFDAAHGGIFYPRAAAVGGCTAHHAMITIYPGNQDWKAMADLTGDASWSPDNMRHYFERLEECRYLAPGEPGQTVDPQTRHGLAGWLPVSMPDPTLALGDKELLLIVFKAFLVNFLADELQGALPTALADNPPSEPANKRRIASALTKAVGHLIETAHTARASFAEPARQLAERLGSELADLHERAVSTENVFQFYADNSDLLELFRLAYRRLDPNRWFEQDEQRTGVFSTPTSILNGVRSAARERILAVRALYPDRLDLITNALATQVIVEDGAAVGIRLVRGRNLYAPSGLAKDAPPLPAAEELRVRARGEIILAGGAFNSPQLLLLSGIGPAAHLREQKIAVQCDLPGVGQNLQDRYEIGLVSEASADFEVLKGSKFKAPEAVDDPNDQALQAWKNHRGVYASNGVVLSVIRRSTQAEGNAPDLFIFGLPGYFKGYFPGYSDWTQKNHRTFTWAILKARTHNQAGEVRLRSADPRDPPDVNFKYFDEGSGPWQKDLGALIEGVQFARQIMQATGLKLKTLVPDVDVQDPKKLGDFIKREAWGHHACGSCKIGKDRDAVLDGDFRVRGVKNLRVVDASVFPAIPGFFIVTSIYMVSEKASDVLLRDRRGPAAPAWPQPVS